MHFITLERLASSQVIPEHPTLRFLVAGMTRGGTQYVANFLRRVGVPAGHESVFGVDGVRELVPFYKKQQIEAEVSGLIAPGYLSRINWPLVHLMRHPVECIRSNMAFFHFTDWDTLCRVYLDWHRAIQAAALFTIHLERFAETVDELVRLAAPNPTPSRSAVEQAMQFVDRGARKYTPHPNGWEQLSPELQEYARSHGYGP